MQKINDFDDVLILSLLLQALNKAQLILVTKHKLNTVNHTH